MYSRLRVVVSGQVQGVAFRYHARTWANGLGLTGWVRNLPDGRVEAVAEGERPLLERFLARMRRGPDMARVEEVEESWEEYRGEEPDFRIRFSGE